MKVMLAAVLLVLSSGAFAAWDRPCQEVRDSCLFKLAINEIGSIESEETTSVLFNLAFHAGRLGYTTIPGGALNLLPEKHADALTQVFLQGRMLLDGNYVLDFSRILEDPVDLLAAQYVAATTLSEWSSDEIRNFLLVSKLRPAQQARLIGQVIVEDLNRGSTKDARYRVDHLRGYISQFSFPTALYGIVALELARSGYVSDAREIIAEMVLENDYNYSQQLTLAVMAFDSVFYGNEHAGLSSAQAISSDRLRLETLADLYAVTGKQESGDAYLSALRESMREDLKFDILRGLLYGISRLPTPVSKKLPTYPCTLFKSKSQP